MTSLDNSGENQMEKLVNMTEKQNVEIDWIEEGGGEEEDQIELAVVGKLWTSRNVNSNELINMMKRVWNPKHGCEANVLVDVEKPLMNKVEIRTGKGSIEVPVKNEKLPVFCYVCGLLGHEEKDCDEAIVARKFSGKLRVSTPCKASKFEEKEEDSTAGSVSKRLFVKKKKYCYPKLNEEEIGDVVEKLQDVSLDLNKNMKPGNEDTQIVMITQHSEDVVSDVQGSLDLGGEVVGVASLPQVENNFEGAQNDSKCQ
uniref:CCHC-type domain-containing protein n=1 Tax=Chenopodium quinoa TaxID=63459 RepID=A0A803MT70_CHEQI